MLLLSSLRLPRCRSHSVWRVVSAHQICVYCSRKPLGQWEEKQAPAGGRRREIGMAWLEYPGRVGLELCTGKPTVSSENAGGFWEEGRGRLLRSLGKVELEEVTSRKKKGGHSSLCGFRADQEEGLLSGRAGPRRSRGMGFRCSEQRGFGQATKHSQVSAGLSGKWGSIASLEVPC